MVATFQIAESDHLPTVAGRTTAVRILNDNMFNIQYWDGQRRLNDGFMTLAKPVLELSAP